MTQVAPHGGGGGVGYGCWAWQPTQIFKDKSKLTNGYLLELLLCSFQISAIYCLHDCPTMKHVNNTLLSRILFVR